MRFARWLAIQRLLTSHQSPGHPILVLEEHRQKIARGIPHAGSFVEARRTDLARHVAGLVSCSIKSSEFRALMSHSHLGRFRFHQDASLQAWRIGRRELIRSAAIGVRCSQSRLVLSSGFVHVRSIPNLSTVHDVKVASKAQPVVARSEFRCLRWHSRRTSQTDCRSIQVWSAGSQSTQQPDHCSENFRLCLRWRP